MTWLLPQKGPPASVVSCGYILNSVVLIPTTNVVYSVMDDDSLQGSTDIFQYPHKKFGGKISSTRTTFSSPSNLGIFQTFAAKPSIQYFIHQTANHMALQKSNSSMSFEYHHN